MNKCIFAFPSVTIAMNAQRKFKEAGFACSVVRTPKTLASGCGYSTVVHCAISEAAAVLERAGINPKASSVLQ